MIFQLISFIIIIPAILKVDDSLIAKVNSDLTFLSLFFSTIYFSESLGDKFFEEMQQKPSQVDYFNIYITDQNDPNILHRTITVSFADLIKHRSSKVDFESELEMEPLSVFSRNHFPSHAHIFKK